MKAQRTNRRPTTAARAIRIVPTRLSSPRQHWLQRFETQRDEMDEALAAKFKVTPDDEEARAKTAGQ